MKNNLNELSKEVFANASRKGFWNEYNGIMERMENSKTPLGVDIFTQSDINAVKFAFSCQRMMLIVSELGEMVEAKRIGKKADWDSYEKVLHEKGIAFDRESFKLYIKDSPEDEFADSIIRHHDMAGGEGINLGKHVEHKMAYNSTRERLHGKNF